MQWQNWQALGSIALFIVGLVLMGGLICRNEQRIGKLTAAVQAATNMEAEQCERHASPAQLPCPSLVRPFADVAQLDRAAGTVRPAELIPRGLSDIIFPDAPMTDRDPGAF